MVQAWHKEHKNKRGTTRTSEKKACALFWDNFPFTWAHKEKPTTVFMQINFIPESRGCGPCPWGAWVTLSRQRPEQPKQMAASFHDFLNSRDRESGFLSRNRLSLWCKCPIIYSKPGSTCSQRLRCIEPQANYLVPDLTELPCSRQLLFSVCGTKRNDCQFACVVLRRWGRGLCICFICLFLLHRIPFCYFFLRFQLWC